MRHAPAAGAADRARSRVAPAVDPSPRPLAGVPTSYPPGGIPHTSGVGARGVLRPGVVPGASRSGVAVRSVLTTSHPLLPLRAASRRAAVDGLSEHCAEAGVASCRSAVSGRMSIRQPVSLAASRAFWPSLPMASDSW